MTKKLIRDVLVVDLDGTLIKTDILVETLMKYLMINPFNLFKFFIFLFKGRSKLKDEISRVVNIDVSLLPYDNEVIKYIKKEKSHGRAVVLATATNKIYAQKIADYLGIFDDVIASDYSVNLASKNKANELIKRYGEAGFDYMGNSKADLNVWSKAKNSIVVNPDKGVLNKAYKLGNVSLVIENRANFFKTLLKALRVHQWAKNVLIFVPLAAAHELTEYSQLFTAFIAFVMFSLCASTVYLLNDLLDLEDDRHHKTKCNRPFASGALDVRFGLILFPTMLLSVFLITLIALPIEFLGVLVSYYVLTLFYSFKLKRMVMVDVITLAMLYTVRIIAGGVVLGLDLTFWLLAFSMFIFLSLAMVKRYAELYEAREAGLEVTRGRGYHPSDFEIISSLGTASGYLSVLVLSLYINEKSTSAMYHYPTLIWLACPLLLYWISRTWMITHRGLMNDDPVVFAMKDRVSQIVGILFISIFWLAI